MIDRSFQNIENKMTKNVKWLLVGAGDIASRRVAPAPLRGGKLGAGCRLRALIRSGGGAGRHNEYKKRLP